MRTPDGSDSNPPPATPLFERLGPAPFARLAAELYRGIDHDARIRSLFPDDLGPESDAVRDMREFLTQFFGGPAEYSMRKGHPRLRARHMRFPIDQSARDAWLENALAALAVVAREHALEECARREIETYLVRTSQFMMNR